MFSAINFWLEGQGLSANLIQSLDVVLALFFLGVLWLVTAFISRKFVMVWVGALMRLSIFGWDDTLLRNQFF
jgi:hypothetical protein